MLYGRRVQKHRPELFRGRHFADEVIVLCVRWYLRFSLSYRDLEEIMAERNLAVDHTTLWRWVQRYAPELNRRVRPELKPTGTSWRADETYIRVAGTWVYLYRAEIRSARPSISTYRGPETLPLPRHSSASACAALIIPARA